MRKRGELLPEEIPVCGRLRKDAFDGKQQPQSCKTHSSCCTAELAAQCSTCLQLRLSLVDDKHRKTAPVFVLGSIRLP